MKPQFADGTDRAPSATSVRRLAKRWPVVLTKHRYLFQVWIVTSLMLVAGCSRAPAPMTTDQAAPGQNPPAEPAQGLSAPAPESAVAEPPRSAEEGAPDLAPPSASVSPATTLPALERQFWSNSSDPEARMAAVRELGGRDPVVVLRALELFFAAERRDDVKLEILAVLADLDSPSIAAGRLALGRRALASDQPPKVRYTAVQVVGGFAPGQARGALEPYRNDRDPLVRAGVRQVLSDLEQP